jgi:hypothetical protein
VEDIAPADNAARNRKPKGDYCERGYEQAGTIRALVHNSRNPKAKANALHLGTSPLAPPAGAKAKGVQLASDASVGPARRTTLTNDWRDVLIVRIGVVTMGNAGAFSAADTCGELFLCGWHAASLVRGTRQSESPAVRTPHRVANRVMQRDRKTVHPVFGIGPQAAAVHHRAGIPFVPSASAGDADSRVAGL